MYAFASRCPSRNLGSCGLTTPPLLLRAVLPHPSWPCLCTILQVPNLTDGTTYPMKEVCLCLCLSRM